VKVRRQAVSSKVENEGQLNGVEEMEDRVTMAVPPPREIRGEWIKLKVPGGKSLK
jgi:hypothetical protein